MKRTLATILLLAVVITTSVSVATVPAPAQASVGSQVATFTGCVAGNELAPWLDQKINTGITNLQKYLANKGPTWVKNLLNFGGVLGGDSVPVNDASLMSAWTNKYSRDDVIARCLARQIINNLTNNTNTIIKTRGRDGGATFVTNWRAFETQAQYRGENIFRAMLSTSNLCPTFGNDLKKAYGLNANEKISLPGVNTRTDSLVPFSVQINCTLPTGFTTQAYQQNFAANGGWNTYAQLAQPQNNLYGASLLAQDEINQQRSLEQSSDLAQVQANKGQTGISGNGKADSCKITGPGGTCIVYKDIKTTGEYLADSAAASIAAEYGWLTTSQGLGSLIEDVTQNMINRLFDQTDTSNYTIATDPVLTIPGVGDSPSPTPPAGGTTPPGGGTPPGPSCSDACHQAENDCLAGCNAEQTCTNACEANTNDCLNQCSTDIPTPTLTTPPACDPTTTTCTPPPAGGSINISQAIIDSGPQDVASWPQTATINSVDITNGVLNFTKQDNSNNQGWPWQTFDGTLLADCTGNSCTDGAIFYTEWIFINNNGKWVGSGFSQCFDRTPGNPRCNDFGSDPAAHGLNDLWSSSNDWPDMYGHVLQHGEQIGVMVTAGNQRKGNKTSLQERSNVFMVTLP